MRKKIATLDKYENIATGDIYYGYPLKDAMKKDIEGVTYIEMTNSVTRPKMVYVKMDNLRRIGEITFEVNQ